MNHSEERGQKLDLLDEMKIEEGAGIRHHDGFHNPNRSRLARSRSRSSSPYSIQT
jgi:hypothetical protein